MDKKTYEYMNERTNKYKVLEEEIKQLRYMHKSLTEMSLLDIGVYNCTIKIPDGAKGVFKYKIMSAIEERLVQIEKEMEEI